MFEYIHSSFPDRKRSYPKLVIVFELLDRLFGFSETRDRLKAVRSLSFRFLSTNASEFLNEDFSSQVPVATRERSTFDLRSQLPGCAVPHRLRLGATSTEPLQSRTNLDPGDWSRSCCNFWGKLGQTSKRSMETDSSPEWIITWPERASPL